MSKLSEEDISLALSTLIGNSAFRAICNNKKNLNIYDAAMVAYGDLKNKDPKSTKAGDSFMTDQQWLDFYSYIEANKETFSQLKITDIKADPKEETNMTVSKVGTRDGYIIYAGTNIHEWHDNAKGLANSDTTQQKEALEYYNDHSKDFDNITVAGHSKGGNKAQYVTVLGDDKIKQAFSFDGQGFSMEFINKYYQEINDNKDKIFSISAKNDYVHALGFKITDNYKYIDYDSGFLGIGGLLGFDNMLFNREDKLAEILGQHSPYAMYQLLYDGTLAKRGEGEEDRVITFLRDLTTYSMLEMSEEDFSYFSNLIMHMLDGKDCSEDFDKIDPPPGFEKRIKLVFEKYAKNMLGLDETGVKEFVNRMMRSGALALSGDKSVNILGAGALYLNLTDFLDDNASSSMMETTRDYTNKKKTEFLELVKEVNNEPFLDFTKWEIWLNVEHLFHDFDMQEGVESYYKKMIDINDMSRRQAEDIFNKVYEIEENLCKDLKKYITDIQTVKSKLQEIDAGLNV